MPIGQPSGIVADTFWQALGVTGPAAEKFLQRMLSNDLAETDHKLLQGRHVHRGSPTNAVQRLVDFCPFHHAAGERGIERGQAEGAIFEDLDQGSTCAEEQHRAEL